jgi:ferritin-like protein
MSEKALARIEKTLEKLSTQQEQIRAELGRLGERGDALASPERSDRQATIRFLDQFRAGEALGEASLAAWIAVCRTECLRGGLRTIQSREGAHARLLAQRIRELGGTPAHELPAAVREAVLADAGNADKPDAQKVLAFVQRFPDVDEALRPICEQADRLGGDPETQSLLRTIAQDERSTLVWLQEACAQLNPEA